MPDFIEDQRPTLAVGRLEDRFQHELGGGLDHPIPDRRHSHIELHFDPVSLWVRLR
jgi:hypothetical protein